MAEKKSRRRTTPAKKAPTKKAPAKKKPPAKKPPAVKKAEVMPPAKWFCQRTLATVEDVDTLCHNCKTDRSEYVNLEACQNVNLSKLD